MELAIATVIGFAIGFIVYRQGIKDGQQLKRELPIKSLIKSPVKVYREAKEIKEVKEFDQGIANLMAYDGTVQE